MTRLTRVVSNDVCYFYTFHALYSFPSHKESSKTWIHEQQVEELQSWELQAVNMAAK